MTTRNTPDLQTKIDLLVPAAARAAVSDAGWHPDTKSGERLYEWAMAQAADGRVPSVREVYEKGHEWNLPVEMPASDPASIVQRIAEARAEGDYLTASLLEDQVRRVRERAERKEPTDAEIHAITEARARAEDARARASAAETEQERMALNKEAQAAWQEASNLQLAAERRMKGNDQPPEPHPIQPTGGLRPDQLALLEDEDKSLTDRLTAAQEQGEHLVASLLQTRIEREGAGG